MTLPESPASQHQQAQAATHQAPAVAPPPPAPSGGSKNDENLTCQWTNCSEKFDTAEDLYVSGCSSLLLFSRKLGEATLEKEEGIGSFGGREKKKRMGNREGSALFLRIPSL